MFDRGRDILVYQQIKTIFSGVINTYFRESFLFSDAGFRDSFNVTSRISIICIKTTDHYSTTQWIEFSFILLPVVHSD